MMLVKEILDTTKMTFSFEFFPPKTSKGWDHLFLTISDLIPLKPSYVSVTYGAGGSTRERTHRLVERIQQETDLTVVAHLTCINASKDEIRSVLETYDQIGVHNILALRGDPPEGQKEWIPHENGFAHAAGLVEFVRTHFPHMCIGVAGFPEGHPDTPNRLKEIEYLKAKVDAGADYIVTQLFFDNRDFYDFRDRCMLAGINVPILAGIMPIISKKGMSRIAELAAGARIPAPLLKAVGRATDDEQVAEVGVHWASEQVRDLIDHKVKGVHFYTLNHARATLAIYKSLGVKDSLQLGN
jgi:methylenetetrahydrofolate reductase (NADPH)